MPAQFDVEGHPFLTNKVLALDPDKFEAQVILAETLLGLRNRRIREDRLEEIHNAISLQVNYQIELGLDAFTSQHVNVGIQAGRGGQSVTYRGYSAPPSVHAQAQKIVAAVLTGLSSGTSSIRGSQRPIRGV